MLREDEAVTTGRKGFHILLDVVRPPTIFSNMFVLQIVTIFIFISPGIHKSHHFDIRNTTFTPIFVFLRLYSSWEPGCGTDGRTARQDA